MIATLKEIQAIRAEVVRLNLSRPPQFDLLSDVELQTIYNGVGPDRFGPETREALTFLYRRYKPTVAIHDVRYQFSDGTVHGWKTADTEFNTNAMKELDDNYPLYNPLLYPVRIWAWSKLKLALAALRLCGSEAYEDAFNRRTAISKLEQS